MGYGIPERDVTKMLKKDLIQEVRDKRRENASLHNALNAQKRIQRHNAKRSEDMRIFRMIRRPLEFTALLTFCVWAWSLIIPSHYTNNSIVIMGLAMVALLWLVMIAYILLKGLKKTLSRYSWIRKVRI